MQDVIERIIILSNLKLVVTEERFPSEEIVWRSHNDVHVQHETIVNIDLQLNQHLLKNHHKVPRRSICLDSICYSVPPEESVNCLDQTACNNLLKFSSGFNVVLKVFAGS